MSETRKLAAILVSDVVGYSRLAGADEDRILARLRTLRSDLIDPTIAVHHGRVVKRTGDGSIVEFRSVVDAVSCAIEVQRAMVERNAGVAPDKRIEFRIGIHLGDVVEESDGDLMGDGVNIAARLRGRRQARRRSASPRTPIGRSRARLDLKVSDLGPMPLKNIAEPMRVYSLEVGQSPREAEIAVASRSGEGAGVQAALGLRPARRRHRRPCPSGRRGRLVHPRRPPDETGASRASFHRGAARSPISPAIRRRTISPTASPRTSPPSFRASTTASSSPATPPSPTRARASTPRRSARSSAFATCSKARCSATRTGCASTRSSSTPRSGAHLWADRFEEDVADLFKLQDQVVARLANSLGYELDQRRSGKGRPLQKSGRHRSRPCAAGHLIQRSIQQPPKEQRESINEARALFDRALQIDPNDADALAGSA